MTMMKQIFGHRELAVETRVLKHDAEFAPNRDGVPGEVVAEHRGGAGLDRHQGRKNPEERAFPTAIGPQEPEDFTT